MVDQAATEVFGDAHSKKWSLHLSRTGLTWGGVCLVLMVAVLGIALWPPGQHTATIAPIQPAIGELRSEQQLAPSTLKMIERTSRETAPRRAASVP